MAEITDDDILEMADRLAQANKFDSQERDAIVLAVQRLIWPPSPHPWMHSGEHITLDIGPRESLGGWFGELRCPSGCGRVWRVNQGPSREAVYDALLEAHTEYRTGRATSVTAPAPGKGTFTLADVFSRAEYVEVQDERLTPKEAQS